MAFRELSEDEIALLNKMEKAQYEKQLKIYRERTAFVEKLEQIGNANIQYTKPKLKELNQFQSWIFQNTSRLELLR